MKILLVFSGNSFSSNVKELDDLIMTHPAIAEQAKELEKLGCVFKLFPIKGHGFKGYLQNIISLKNAIKSERPNIVHAHYGLSGLLAILQREAPVIITFHGSDINNSLVGIFSAFASLVAKYRIFVSHNLYRKILIRPKAHFSIIPCGVNLEIFYPIEKSIAREQLDWGKEQKIILFASSFSIPVKNAYLAKQSMAFIDNAQLVELTGWSRKKVNLALNACDLLLMTSLSEGSPQVIKEAMACNCPIVSTNVGDVKDVIGGTNGCYLTSFDVTDIAEKINLAFAFGRRTNGRNEISHFDNKLISAKINQIYQSVVY